jgi:hypothetical protein
VNITEERLLRLAERRKADISIERPTRETWTKVGVKGIYRRYYPRDVLTGASTKTPVTVFVTELSTLYDTASSAGSFVS